MAIVDRFDAFLIDLDGVVYVGDGLVPGSDRAVRALRELGKRVVFLTNDPRSSREEYAAKLRRMGLGVEASDVLTSGCGHRRVHRPARGDRGPHGLRDRDAGPEGGGASGRPRRGRG